MRDLFDRDHPEAARRLEVLRREAGRELSPLVREDITIELTEVETIGGPSMAEAKATATAQVVAAPDEVLEAHSCRGWPGRSGCPPPLGACTISGRPEGS